ncbi:MAG: ATP-grasp domain-containing protein, partial [Methylococcales bacterium]
MMQTESRPLVVIGQSARMLAVSAARARLKPIAIDLFADCDTREVAPTIVLSSFEKDQVFGALKRVSAQCGRVLLVYGSGIDSRPDWVEDLSEWVELVGNGASVLRVLNDPKSFFGLLDSLAIPYPEIRFSRPHDPNAWLYKIPFTEGGGGVFPVAQHPGPDYGYYQKKLDGPALSVLFLANRREALIIGFNTQWTAGHDTRLPYLFGGIMNTTGLTLKQRLKVAGYVAKLTRSVQMVGLNSLDFMLDQHECCVLEVNPRPSSSLILYDKCFRHGLLAEHIRTV